MLDRPPGPMHEIIRRAQEEIRGYSNNYGAIKLISAALQQAEPVEDDAAPLSSPSPLPLPSPAAPPRLALNRTQRLRLLLLRADAHAATRQHDASLADAHAALRLSGGRSAEAHAAVGRALLRLHRPDEALAALERGEAHQLRAGAAAVADADFWAQRGLEMREAARQRLVRGEVERREMEEACGMEEAQPMSRERLTWRRLTREARALVKLRTSRVVPLSLLPSSIAMLNHRIADVRSGLIVCVENTTCLTFRFVCNMSPNAGYHAGMSFPDTIAPNHCGFALITASAWGGFVGSVCYELGEGGICCALCYEIAFMGSVRCGVRGASDKRGVSDAADVRELCVANTNLWTPTHTALLPSGRRLKVSSSLRTASGKGGGRTVVFSVAEILPVRLRSIELLRALEFAGPLVLKKMSAVSRRYRELVNNFPPHMFFAPGRRSYPDYCLPSDRMSSPWIVRDKEPVTWLLLYDSRTGNRENYVVVDSSDTQNVILLFSADPTSAMEALVYYGDRRSPIAQIKNSWLPFSSTLYICSASGRTIASCALKQSSHLSLSWEGGNGKSKQNDIEFIMLPSDATGSRLDESAKASLASTLAGSTHHFPETGSAASSSLVDEGTVLQGSTRSAPPLGKKPLGGSFAIWRPMRSRVASLTRGSTSPNNGGMELLAEMLLNVNGFSSLTKGTRFCEMKIFPGTDALLLSLFVYCRSQWGS